MSSVRLEFGVAAETLAGRRLSGDRHVVCGFDGGMLLGVLDGLGHGQEAHEAAHIAGSMLEAHPSEDLASLFARCHESLRAARGVVMSLASFRFADGTFAWAGVGNVEGRLLRANGGGGCESLLLKAGLVGLRIPIFEAQRLPVAPGDTLVLFTDGIEGPVSDTVRRGLPPQEIANHILQRHQKGTDDALVLVARYPEEVP
ncbi:MAG TPA: SpoIIE family protein phosphatase [Candidatus Polarisedimenticolia bacterium]|nr:SpoIIE family protein phosphatase [Candidatus Polarisedimenticolia bacterium]